MNQPSSRPLRKIAAALLAVTAIAGITAAVASAMTSNSHKSAKHQAQITVGVKQNAMLGGILEAGSRHLTVYMFGLDRGGKSKCTGGCASAWPPVVTAGMPKAGTGAHKSDLGTIKRAHGVQQVSYKGHPLYYFEGDRSAKMAAGQGINAFGAHWYVLAASGRVVTKQPGMGSTTTTGTSQTSPATGYGSPPASTNTDTTSNTTTTGTTGTTTTSASPPDVWS